MMCPALALVGCNQNKAKAIDMTQYFDQKVRYTIFSNGNKSSQSELRLSSFTDDNYNTIDNSGNELLKPYYTLSFSGVSSWLYKMYIEEIKFGIYSNMDMEVQFMLTLTNVHKGSSSSTNDKTITVPVPVQLLKGKVVEASVSIKDYIDKNDATTTLTIEIQDPSYFRADGVDTGLKFDISELRVIAIHDSSKWEK